MRFFISVLLLVSALFSKEYTQSDRIHDMQIMSEAMTTIEKGFFYNNEELVISGVANLEDAIKRVKLSKDEKYSSDKLNLSKKSIDVIKRKAKIIKESFKKGDVLKAVMAHSKITNRCMECHTLIRKW